MSPDRRLAEEAPENPFFRALADWVLRYRWFVLLANLAITVGLGWATTTLREDPSADPFLPEESDAQALNERFKDDFGYDVYSILVIEGDVFSVDYLQRLKALHEDVEAIDVKIPSLGMRKHRNARAPSSPQEARTAPGDFDEFGNDERWDSNNDWGDERGGSIFEEVTSLINVRQTRGSEEGIRVEGLLDEMPTEAEIPALRRRVLADRSIVGRLVGPGAHHSALTARTDYMLDTDSPIVYEALQEVAEKHQAPGSRSGSAECPRCWRTSVGWSSRT